MELALPQVQLEDTGEGIDGDDGSDESEEGEGCVRNITGSGRVGSYGEEFLNRS